MAKTKPGDDDAKQIERIKSTNGRARTKSNEILKNIDDIDMDLDEAIRDKQRASDILKRTAKKIAITEKNLNALISINRDLQKALGGLAKR
jgi:exonuclease VII small subunit